MKTRLIPKNCIWPLFRVLGKTENDPLRAMSIFTRKVMGHTAVSAIQGLDLATFND